MFGNGGLAAEWLSADFSRWRPRITYPPFVPHCWEHDVDEPCLTCQRAVVITGGKLVEGWRSRPRRQTFPR